MSKIPEKCPACGSNLIVTQLTCTSCGTQVQGQYTPDLFARLSPNDYDFVVLCVKTKGNVKEMERELGISYWTIRNKLSEIVKTLGLDADAPDRESLSAQRQAILRQLNDGEISVDEAAELLEQLKGLG